MSDFGLLQHVLKDDLLSLRDTERHLSSEQSWNEEPSTSTSNTCRTLFNSKEGCDIGNSKEGCDIDNDIDEWLSCPREPIADFDWSHLNKVLCGWMHPFSLKEKGPKLLLTCRGCGKSVDVMSNHFLVLYYCADPSCKKWRMFRRSSCMTSAYHHWEAHKTQDAVNASNDVHRVPANQLYLLLWKEGETYAATCGVCARARQTHYGGPKFSFDYHTDDNSIFTRSNPFTIQILSQIVRRRYPSKPLVFTCGVNGGSSFVKCNGCTSSVQLDKLLLAYYCSHCNETLEFKSGSCFRKAKRHDVQCKKGTTRGRKWKAAPEGNLYFRTRNDDYGCQVLICGMCRPDTAEDFNIEACDVEWNCTMPDGNECVKSGIGCLAHFDKSARKCFKEAEQK